MNNNFGQLIIGSMPVGSEKISVEMENAISTSNYILCENVNSFIADIYGVNNIKTNATIATYEDIKVSKALELIKLGNNILIVTECGYPAIADPGSSYISACNFDNIKISIISGASIASMAFVASGLQKDQKGFIYQSLFDFDLQKKISVLSQILSLGYPIVLLDYNDDYKLVIEAIEKISNKEYTVAVCVDLSTKDSAIYMYSLKEARDYFTGTIRGMHSIVIREKE